ncbi:MAG: glycosyltransferase 87 family protein [Actinomycetota bacterium]|nr:glycosyltransferase 87 family protein [Actinomycetota bacterium]
MAAEAFVFLSYELWRLLLDKGSMGAVDLGLRLDETHTWFDGLPVYGRFITAVYPPATYAILWPFVGSLQFNPARWLWAATSVVSLVWLAILLVRESKAGGRLERALVVLMLLSIYPTGQTIGNGQLLTLVLPPLLTGLLLLGRSSRGLLLDLLVAMLLVVSLVKPTGSLPFLLLACFLPSGIRALLLTSLGYIGLTLLAASYQSPALPTLVHRWLDGSRDLAAAHGSAFYANADAWLGSLGLKSWILPVSLAILVAFGLWTWRHRRVDLWLLIGVAAIVARFWSYHRSYDDLLILLSMVAFFRIAKEGGAARNHDVLAGLLLALTLAVMVVPSGLFFFPRPLRVWFTSLESAIWLVGLAFLLLEARAANLARGRPSSTPRRDCGLRSTARPTARVAGCP